MSNLEVSKSDVYDRFCEETDAMFARYNAAAAQVIRTMTKEKLSSATMHPDGFIKLQIGPEDFAANGQVRLHFWVPGRLGTKQPHSHPWHLASRNLVGTYTEFLPRLAEDDGAKLNRYQISYPSGKDQRAGITVPERHKLYRKEDGAAQITPEGMNHYLPAGPIHMSSPDGAGGITLAVMSRRFSDEANFYAEELTDFDASVSSEDAEVVMDMIQQVRTQL